jgi:predicted RNA-binding Zn-ribbon protein involved in translation (DUF1610 family)
MMAEQMRCPKCGAAMNHHAEKIDYAAALEDPAAADPALGGVLEEVFTCPRCGNIEMRRASA